MKKSINQCNNPYFRFLTLVIAAILCFTFVFTNTGCSTFKAKKKEAVVEKEKTAFDSAREEHDKLGEFVASAGRKNPKEKKDIDPGQTFLLSDKAKEIYRNTER